MEKRISDFAKSAPLLFNYPENPSACYIEWRQLLDLRLQSFLISPVLLPIKDALEKFKAQFDEDNEDKEQEKKSDKKIFFSIFQLADISTRIFILQSLPTQFKSDHNSFTAKIDERDDKKEIGQSLTLYRCIKDELFFQLETEKQELVSILVREKKATESMSTFIGAKENARQILKEKYEDTFKDTLFRSFLISGIRNESKYERLYHQLTLVRPIPSLKECIQMMQIASREIEVTNSSSSRAIPFPSPPAAIGQANAVSNSSKVRPCYNFGNSKCKRGDDCNYQHIERNKCKAFECPMIRTCKRDNCAFLHPTKPTSSSTSSSSSSSSSGSALTAESQIEAAVMDAWSL